MDDQKFLDEYTKLTGEMHEKLTASNDFVANADPGRPGWDEEFRIIQEELAHAIFEVEEMWKRLRGGRPK
ncbi:hypothetical protein [Pseudomonas graminis]|uniref:Uncharacterized protein n=1 Tax=Pseudomonas graminis TaxID=158627 RepID=A0A6M8MRF4_9PSED|nr:hypothetical protein [Pseudomonas graminis]QKF52782.1 hypothetical protein FX982_03774 [Pseudomonas graminis]